MSANHTADYLYEEPKNVLDTFEVDIKDVCSFSTDDGSNVVKVGSVIESQQDIMHRDEIIGSDLIDILDSDEKEQDYYNTSQLNELLRGVLELTLKKMLQIDVPRKKRINFL